MLRPPLLITAGPTFEDLDHVRFLGNRSSGELGLCLAGAAASRGWKTTIALGPVSRPSPLPSSVRCLRFRSTADLQALLREEWPQHASLIMAAAVADFRPAAPDTGKLRRQGETLTLTLEPTPDLLAECGHSKRPNQCLVGFALEPEERLLTSAEEKLQRKKLDAIVANPLETMEAGDIEPTLLRPGQAPLRVPRQTKAAFASWLLDHLSAGP
jgi:phosphopantothenoylcysteine decarboxylase/phosphopantothenate--cysteine ligase